MANNALVTGKTKRVITIGLRTTGNLSFTDFVYRLG